MITGQRYIGVRSGMKRSEMYTPDTAVGRPIEPTTYVKDEVPAFTMDESPMAERQQRFYREAEGASGPQKKPETAVPAPILLPVHGMPGLEPMHQRETPEVPLPTAGRQSLEDRQQQDSSPLGSTPRKANMKLPKYNGDGLLETYLVQVQLAADFNGWSSEETGVQVALALEGKALQTLMDLRPGQHASWPAIKDALQRRFGQRIFRDDARERLASRYRKEGESLGAFAADLRLYARRGYATFADAEQEELALQAFMRGLRPERLREHIRLHFPSSLIGALDEAERVEHVLCATKHQARQVEVVMENNDDSEAAETRQVSVSETRRYPRNNPRRQRKDEGCYRCGEAGHVARHCMAPAPRTAPIQPASNQ